jgi:hypothetical protein
MRNQASGISTPRIDDSMAQDFSFLLASFDRRLTGNTKTTGEI